LSEIAAALGAPLLHAARAHAQGAVLLATGDIAGASALLRQACEAWRDLAMPLEEAHTHSLLAAVCERRGDPDGHRLEFDAAIRLLRALDAEHGVARIGAKASKPSAGPLSERELQVLRLIAGGKTNREIGEALFISEKTVARHVSNIFDKLGVSSRTGAAAWAYQHDLV
jgi:DNA-binding NarL/FixJ family response regulator